MKIKPGAPVTPIIVESVESNSTEAIQTNTAKTVFIEPELSSPIDVLEATTFFQLTDSGATN